MLPAETVAISLGDGHSGASIVLPRGHQLVKHLEALLVPNAAPAAHVMRPELTTKRHSHDAIAALTSLSHQSAPTLPALPRHLFNHHSPSSVGSFTAAMLRPASPYLSDSSHSSNSSSTVATNGVRRRRTASASQANGKKCQITDCDKISVSRGLCRGHGGGRRCQHAGCSKGAQSRSDFCWGHGGGQRCEVPNCMRSRKTKRFCVAHLNWEHAGEGVPLPAGEMTPRIIEPAPKMIMPRVVAPEVLRPSLSAKLPSLQQALQKHHHCMPAPSHGVGFASSYGPIMNSA